MAKKLLIIGASLLLTLVLAFAVVPAHVAHADSCNGACGQDPVVAGCTSSQFVMDINHFNVNGQTWAIRLMGTNSTSPACNGEEWASLVLTSGNNPGLPNSVDIKVFSYSGDPFLHQCTHSDDILFSSFFGSGAWTNMVPVGDVGDYAQYDGNGQDPRAGPTGIPCR